MRVKVDVVTMVGQRYLLVEREGRPQFPHGDLGASESVGAAARRILREWTGLADPKLDLVDVRSLPDEVSLVVRAIVADPPKVPHRTAGRMELPADVGRLPGKWVEEALKTSIAYKLTRPDS